MKRKRKSQCPSPLLDDSSKKTKVHAQRKFAQGSNVNSPVITPIKELEAEMPHIDVMPEPVELLPMKRPNTEDFLTFLCFRGTPILPPSLNFFNTASIVDTNGQVHEIKSEGPKNGPIDIAKCSNSEKPFIAFGVRKRADPIIISKQMDRKRRHALALQALRRKYQEQKMAKIRALTISKLSEKATNRTVLKTSIVSKTEAITKKTNYLQKNKILSTKHVKVTTQTLKTTLRPKIKPSLKQNMCLRSFRGRFVHKELPFRKTIQQSDVRKGVRRPLKKVVVKKNKRASEHSILKTSAQEKTTDVKQIKKIGSHSLSEIPEAISSRVTRSEMSARRKQLKKRMLMANPSTLVKSRSLRLTTVNKTIISQRKTNMKCITPKVIRNDNPPADTKVNSILSEKRPIAGDGNKMENKIETRKSKIQPRKETRQSLRKLLKCRIEVRRDISKTANIKKVFERNRRLLNQNLDMKKEKQSIDNKKEIVRSADAKKDDSKATEGKKGGIKLLDIKKDDDRSVHAKKDRFKLTSLKRGLTRSSKRDVSRSIDIKNQPNLLGNVGKEVNKPAGMKSNVTKKVNAKKYCSNSTQMKKEVGKIKNIKKDLPDIKKKDGKLAVPKKEVNKVTDVQKVTEKPAEDVVVSTELKKGTSKPVDFKKEVFKPNDSIKSIAKAVEAKKEIITRSSEAKTPVNVVEGSNKEEAKSPNFNRDICKITETRKKMDVKKEDAIKPATSKKDFNKILTSSVLSNDSKIEFIHNNSVDTKNKVTESESQVEKGYKNTTISSEKTPQVIVQLMEATTAFKTDILDSCKKNDDNIEKKVKAHRNTNQMNKEPLIPRKETNSDQSKGNKESPTFNTPQQAYMVDSIKKVESPKSPTKKNMYKKNEDLPKLYGRMLAGEKSPTANSRPTRKTKEAAAIYMEILSHKLGSDSKVDDDNISIDSFPELPNVKKTEQRENELKAQAKSSKDDTKAKESGDETKGKNKGYKNDIKDEELETISKKQKCTTANEMNNPGSDSSKKTEENRSKEIDIFGNKRQIVEKKNCVGKEKNNPGFEKGKIKNAVADGQDVRVTMNKIHITDKSGSPTEEAKSLAFEKDNESCKKIFVAEILAKDRIQATEKKNTPTKKASDPVSELIKVKTNKESEKLQDSGRRHTRNSALIHRVHHSDDSDESFHISVKVPRKRKITRSKGLTKSLKASNVSLLETDIPENTQPKVDDAKVAKNQERIKKPPTECSPDSDHSTTSDMNLKVILNKVKNKKFSKTKSMTKAEQCFSDSDEEPLSKLTNKSADGSHRSETVKPNETRLSTSKKEKVEIQKEIPAAKPKRECAKRPQNYLPMLSSSDEDEIFHGFDENTKDKVIKKPLEVTLAQVPPLLELFSKDLDRRFGKEKVNMSNAQIEKWLNDSALAGNSIKKENDEMLKFGERIPTETLFDNAEAVDMEKLKFNMLSTPTKSNDMSKTEDSKVVDGTRKTEVEKTPKHLALDRKPIFRKGRAETRPNVNAFSPENESSVYAFGEDNDEVVSTPFRRPSRRPSSTGTSKSEDESSKQEDLKKGQFRIPLVKQEHTKSKEELESSTDADDASYHFYIPQKPCKSFTKTQSGAMKSKHIENRPLNRVAKSTDRLSAECDDFKYKIPSSPSASSSSSAKIYKRQTPKQKSKTQDVGPPVYASEFPKRTDPAKLVEAPIFHPTDQEFQDPLEYIERIRHKAEQFGICKIVPPSSFKPECKVSDDMRFTAYNQYVHKMLHRWGPNFKELMAIKKYLETQNIGFTHSPWIGGMEIDLPRLYQTVQNLGGLKEVIEKKRWPRVSELMKIPKSAQDRVTKLDDIYCKYLLPYDTLSPAERQKLFDEVEAEWAKRESKSQRTVQEKPIDGEIASERDSSEQDFNEAEECITKGRNMALNAFYRIARNTMSMHFKNSEPCAQEVEQEYWKYVTLRQNHICVHSGSIDSGSWGYGFAVSKNSPFAKHSWNLKVLTNNSGSVLRSLGPVMGVTVPTLHVGMVFSACCWYRDPHGLPWIEYLHTGGSKIWYGIPNTTSDQFRAALEKLVPNCCRDKELWLPSDTIMVPPSLLIEKGVSLCRTVQEPGQFVVVFPKAFTSSISTGYVVSESVYFAPPYWLKGARNLFDVLRNSSEPSMFSLDRLLINIANDTRSNIEILRLVLSHVQDLCREETEKRAKLKSFGELERERIPLADPNNRKKKKTQGEEGDYECEICRVNLFTSMVFDTHDNVIYCLDHAIEMLEKEKSKVLNYKFMFTYDDGEIQALPEKIKSIIETKGQKKIPNKFAGMPTLLGKQ
nr:unnamed protein product [Callosobruchus chinensis]